MKSSNDLINRKNYLCTMRMLLLFFLSFQLVAQDVSWVNNTSLIRSYSSPRTTDLNNDGIEDVVIGGGVDGFPTPYGIVDGIFVASQSSKIIYFTILISHIILSIVLIPLVLLAYSKTVLLDFETHKKIARIAFPIWLYVTITGVVVYLMISPYYT